MKHLLILVALLLVASMSFAQQSGDILYDATVASVGGPLLVTAGDAATWADLQPGMAYQCVADAAVNTNITPFTAETFTPGIIDIAGAVGAQVVVTFSLPAKLYPQAAGTGTISMAYTNQSAAVVDLASGLAISFFNPEVPKTFTLDIAGLGQIWYGGNPSVSADALDDQYLGYGLVTAEYTGM
jgi:hypothetical protein